MKGSDKNNREAKLRMKNAAVNSAGGKSASNALVTWLMKEQSFIKPLAVGSKMMRLNMAEREPQNKLTVFEGFMSGLITMVKLPEMLSTRGEGATIRSRRAREWKRRWERRC